MFFDKIVKIVKKDLRVKIVGNRDTGNEYEKSNFETETSGGSYMTTLPEKGEEIFGYKVMDQTTVSMLGAV